MGLIPMDANILPPSNDRIFKRLLTAQEPDAKKMLADLISSIIGRTVTSVAIRNNELPTNFTEEKQPRLDVNCRLNDGTQIDLEMHASQIQEEDDGQFQNVKGKSIFYMCGLHSSQSAKGLRRYDKLPQTWQVTFCSYTIFPELPNYLNSFSMRHDENNVLLSNAICAVFVELSKLDVIIKKSVDDMTELEKWAIFFEYVADPKHRDEVNKIIESKEELQMAGKILMEVSQDEHEQAMYRSYQMFQTDMQSNLATAYDNGLAEGLAKGLAEGRNKRTDEIIRNLKADNISFEVIARASGMPIEYVQNLL